MYSDKALTTLRFALQDDSVEIRNAAVEALRLAGVPAIPVLIEALQIDRPDIRRLAAEALRFRSTNMERYPGMDLVCKEPELPVALVADIRAALLRALCDGVPAVRMAATRAIGQYVTPNDDAVVFKLRGALQDEDVGVRMGAISTLQTLGVANPKELVDIALEGLASDDIDHLNSACWLLLKGVREISGAEVSAAVTESADARPLIET